MLWYIITFAIGMLFGMTILFLVALWDFGRLIKRNDDAEYDIHASPHSLPKRDTL